jgi:muramoyltetrapeptide carboxypeptidase
VSKTKKTSPKKQKKVQRSKATKKPVLTALKAGDTIQIIAPGSHSPIQHLEKGAEVLRSWGINVIYDKQLIDPQIFLSNTDEYRFKSFKSAFENKEVKMIWCLRGGYGAIRLLPYLEKMKAPKVPKILIGLSDISSLQVAMAKHWNMPSLHTALVDRFALEKLTEENISEIKKSLFDPEFEMHFENLEPINSAAEKNKKISSKVIGGNLMVVASTLGTPSQIEAEGKIIFLEELCERAYRIDRCLQQLKQAQVFSKAKAIIFGDFTNCDEPNKDNYVSEVLANFCRDIKIPAFKGLQNGHGELQRPLFFNTEATLVCGKKGSLKVKSPFEG